MDDNTTIQAPDINQVYQAAAAFPDLAVPPPSNVPIYSGPQGPSAPESPSGYGPTSPGSATGLGSLPQDPLQPTKGGVVKRTLGAYIAGMADAMGGGPQRRLYLQQLQLRNEQLAANTRDINSQAAMREQATTPVLLTDPSTGHPMYTPDGSLRMGSLAEQKELNDTFKVTGGSIPIPDSVAQALGYPELSGRPIAAKAFSDLIKSQNKPETLEQLISQHAQRAIQAGQDPNTDPTVQSLLHIRSVTTQKPQTTGDLEARYLDLYSKAHSGQQLTPEETGYLQAYEHRLTLVPSMRIDAGAGSKNDARSDRSYQYSNNQLNSMQTPIEALNGRMSRLQASLDQNTPQADALVAPELLTVMAGGQGSGLRMNEAEISRIVGGRSNWQSLQAAANKWSLDPSTANSITPDQRQQIRALVSEVQKRVTAQSQILNDARDQLNGTDDPAQHRQIVAGVRRKLSDISGPQPQGSTNTPAGSVPTFSQWKQQQGH